MNKIIFAGTPAISANILNQLINAKFNIIACYSQPDRPKGRGQKSCFSPVKNMALTHNIPTLQPTSLKDPQTINQLQQLQPDLIIVFAYGLIFPQEVLTIPKFGCINIHTSLLPKWRGAAPTQHAILAGDTITGISIIRMDPGLDTGAILYNKDCQIAIKETNESLLNKLQPLAIEGILTVLQQLSTNTLIATKQDHSVASYATKIEKADAKINWNSSAITIERRIRAFIPEPIAFTSMDQINNIKIWQGSVITEPTKYFSETSKVGIIKEITSKGILVTTQQDLLQIEKIQMPGGKILTTIELLNAPKYQQLFKINKQFD